MGWKFLKEIECHSMIHFKFHQSVFQKNCDKLYFSSALNRV